MRIFNISLVMERIARILSITGVSCLSESDFDTQGTFLITLYFTLNHHAPHRISPSLSLSLKRLLFSSQELSHVTPKSIPAHKQIASKYVQRSDFLGTFITLKLTLASSFKPEVSLRNGLNVRPLLQHFIYSSALFVTARADMESSFSFSLLHSSFLSSRSPC